MANTVFYGSMAQPGVQARTGLGVISVISVYSASATISTSQTIRMAKLPDGAKIIDVILNCPVDTTSVSTATELSVGIPGSATLFIKSATAGASAPVHINCATGIGYVVDVSDDTAAAVPYKWLEIECKTGATGTASAVITLAVLYTMAVQEAD